MPEALRHTTSDFASAPFRKVRLGKPDLDVTHRDDGAILIRPRQALGEYPVRITDRLIHWADKTPDRTLFAGRDTDGSWRRIRYAQALKYARSIGEALLARNLSAERPVAILSGNDLEHAMVALGCLYAGVAYAPISPAYSLISEDFGKLKHIFKLLTPGFVFASDGRAFGRAIETVVPADVEVAVTRNPPASRPALTFAQLAETKPTSAIDTANAKVGPDTIAKFLFTSGSTGQPKGVINTQRMLCANQAMIRSALRYFEDEPPVTVDWAPWHHTAGGNHDVGLVLFNGGTFYIDEGKPLPGAVEATVRNLKDVSPNFYFNVPKGFEALLPFLRSDAQLRESFFRDLKVLWFAGAALSKHVFDEMQELAYRTLGERVLFLTGFGATETAPAAFVRTEDTDNPTNMGLPVAGLELKLVPTEGKLEARVKGPNVTPGYWRAPDLTAKAFDEEGYYKLGDAMKFADPADPRKGFLFDGRVAEDFKLSTGTWVSVGPLRAKLIDHFAPYMRDVVIAGLDRNEIGVLVFAVAEHCREFAPDLPADCAPHDILTDPRVLAHFRRRLAEFARHATGSSNRVCRLMLLAEPPSLDRGEITDKGSINQRAVLANRAELVEILYDDAAHPHVVTIHERN